MTVRAYYIRKFMPLLIPESLFLEKGENQTWFLYHPEVKRRVNTSSPVRHDYIEAKDALHDMIRNGCLLISACSSLLPFQLSLNTFLWESTSMNFFNVSSLLALKHFVFIDFFMWSCLSNFSNMSHSLKLCDIFVNEPRNLPMRL